MTSEEKKKIVIDFLQKPIIRGDAMLLTDSRIVSSQTYYSSFDPDMSTIAIEFYKIIYELDSLIDENGLLIDKQFAGDTMCSFNTIANMVQEAGRSAKTRTPYSEWPDFLKNYYNSYHCLANFWILPIWIGRSWIKMPSEHRWASKSKKGTDDYVDRYLSFMKDKQIYERFKIKYNEYGKKFDSYEKFTKNHFLKGDKNYIRDGEIYLFSNNKPENIVNDILELIEARAEAISESKYCDKLYDLYLSLCR